MTDQSTQTDRAYIKETAEEPRMPGQEVDMERKPEWRPRYPGSGRLKGKLAIVTGGDSGIGRATAVLFAREGADVAIAYLSEHDDANITREACEAEGAQVLLSAGDLGDIRHVNGFVEAVMDRFGRIDVLVNNAGEQHPDKEITDITPEQLQRTFQTNIFSQFYMVQACRPHLKRGAAIVNCTSVTMYKGSGGLLDYSATKGAITAFTRSLSENLTRGWHSCERRCAGADLDAAQPVRRTAAGEHPRFRRVHPNGAGGGAERGGALLPVPGVRGFILYERSGAASQRRDGRQWLVRGRTRAR